MQIFLCFQFWLKMKLINSWRLFINHLWFLYFFFFYFTGSWENVPPQTAMHNIPVAFFGSTHLSQALTGVSQVKRKSWILSLTQDYSIWFSGNVAEEIVNDVVCAEIQNQVFEGNLQLPLILDFSVVFKISFCVLPQVHRSEFTCLFLNYPPAKAFLSFLPPYICICI